MGFVSDFADDVLGFDPNGGGIHDVPVVGDVVDDVLGADPGESPLEQLGSVAATIGAGVGAAGLAGFGPAAGLNTAVTQPALNAVGLGSAPAAATAAAPAAAGGVTAGQAALAAAPAVTAAAPLVTGGAQAAQDSPSWWQTAGDVAGAVGNVAGAAGQVAGAVNAGAQLYDAVTGGGAAADRALVRRTVADVAPLTALQQEGIQSGVAAARDPRAAAATDRLYDAQALGSGALGTGVQGLTDIATGSDAYTNRLAGQAASAAHLGAASQGSLGSARGQRAAHAAAADTIARRQQSALGTLTSTGQGLLDQGRLGYNLSTAPGTSLRNLGATQQAHQQKVLDQQAARDAALLQAELREPTTAERVGQVAGALEELPTVYDQARQGGNSLLNLFRS